MILGGVRPTLCVAFLFTYCVVAWKPNAPNQNNFPLSIFIFLSFSILLPSLFDYLFHLIVDWFPWKPEVICLLRVSLDTIKTRAGRREREKAERHRERLRKSDAMQRGIKNSFSSRCHTLSASELFPALSRRCFWHIHIFWVMVSSATDLLSGLLKSWICFLTAVWCSWSFGSNIPLLCRRGPGDARKITEHQNQCKMFLGWN